MDTWQHDNHQKKRPKMKSFRLCKKYGAKTIHYYKKNDYLCTTKND